MVKPKPHIKVVLPTMPNRRSGWRLDGILYVNGVMVPTASVSVTFDVREPVKVTVVLFPDEVAVRETDQ